MPVVRLLKDWMDAKLVHNSVFSKLFWWHRIANFEDDIHARPLTEVGIVVTL